MERYVELIQSLFQLRQSSGKIAAVHASLGSPGTAYPTVHVAGTNGKGSVVLKIASSLSHAGYVVGYYISPHIDSFRERIQINGKRISREDVVRYLDYIQDVNKERCNFFEITTMLALLYFRDQKVDIAVIETGMGGRLDATNVIAPLLSVITTVTKDHEKELGNTLEEIARQKAGIIKENSRTLVGYRAAYKPMLEEAFAKKIPITFLPPCKNHSYSVENKEIAREALSILARYFPLSEEDICEGLSQEQPCRFERVELPGGMIVIFDVAHNGDGFTRLIARLKKTYPDKNYHVLFGIGKEKNPLECAELLSQIATSVHLITPSYGRGMDSADLQDVFYCIGYKSVVYFSSVEETMQSLFAKVEVTEDIVVVCGTFYIMQPITNWLIEHCLR